MDSIELLFLETAEEVYLTEQATAQHLYETDHDHEPLNFDDEHE